MKALLFCLISLQGLIANPCIAAEKIESNVIKSVTVPYESVGTARVDLTEQGEIFITPRINKDEVRYKGLTNLERTREAKLKIGDSESIRKAAVANYSPVNLIATNLFSFQNRLFAVVEPRIKHEGRNNGPFLLNIEISQGKKRSLKQLGVDLIWPGILLGSGLATFSLILDPQISYAYALAMGSIAAFNIPSGIMGLKEVWDQSCLADASTCAVGLSPAETFVVLGVVYSVNDPKMVLDVILENPKDAGRALSLSGLFKEEGCEAVLIDSSTK